MYDEQNLKPEELYERGLAYYRAAEWEAAIQDFSRLQATSNAFPEVDDLLANAKLKIEIERSEAPPGILPPKYRTFLRPRFATAVPVLLILGLLLLALRPKTDPAPTIAPAPTQALALPTRAPTNTPVPAPTGTAAPTGTPAPTATPGPGTLVVRLAAQQSQPQLDSIELILDASGSMGALVGNRRRIDIAHDALATLIGQMPEGVNVGLRTYGHRRSGDCNDIELVVPPGPLDPANMTAHINAINPVRLGQTPLGASLSLAGEDLKAVSGDVRVVLVTDGEETCRADPVRVAAQLRANNPRLTLDVIGFNVDSRTSARLGAIAQAGGGRYFDAADAQQLVDALRQSVLRTYRVRDAAGNEVYTGQLGSSANLPAGRYTVEIAGAAPLTIGGVTVDGAHPATVELHEENGKLVATLAP